MAAVATSTDRHMNIHINIEPAMLVCNLWIVIIMSCSTAHSMTLPDFADLFEEANTVADLITRNPPVRVAHFLQECSHWMPFTQLSLQTDSLMDLCISGDILQYHSIEFCDKR